MELDKMIQPCTKIIMPFSNVLHLDITEKLKTTQLAGLTSLSIQPQEVKKILIENNLSLADLKRMAEDFGVKFSRIDPLCTWVPNWTSINFDEKFNTDHSTSIDEFLEIATGLGASSFSLNGIFPSNRYSLDELSDHFYKIDQLANEHGLICDLEPIPMWGIKTIEDAWSIIKNSGSKFGGIIFDSIHFIRGRSSFAMLDDIPSERIHSVQLSDGALDINCSLEEDCFQRLWPEEGEFPLIDMIHYLHNKGALREVCAEVFSHQHKNMSTEQIGSLSKQSIMRLLKKANIDVSELKFSIQYPTQLSSIEQLK